MLSIGFNEIYVFYFRTIRTNIFQKSSNKYCRKWNINELRATVCDEIFPDEEQSSSLWNAKLAKLFRWSLLFHYFSFHTLKWKFAVVSLVENYLLAFFKREKWIMANRQGLIREIQKNGNLYSFRLHTKISHQLIKFRELISKFNLFAPKCQPS